MDSAAKLTTVPKVQGPDGKEHNATPLSFQNAREHWNEYLLEDGTLLKIKLVATEAFKVEDLKDDEGNPIYVMKSKNVLVVVPPR